MKLVRIALLTRSQEATVRSSSLTERFETMLLSHLGVVCGMS